MSRALTASCLAGVVQVAGITVPGCIILTAGVGQSTGICFIDGANAYFVATNTIDLKSTLDNIISSLSQLHTAIGTIATTLTAIGAGMTGSSTAPPGSLAANVTAINACVTALDGIKTTLTTLEGNLK